MGAAACRRACSDDERPHLAALPYRRREAARSARGDAGPWCFAYACDPPGAPVTRRFDAIVIGAGQAGPSMAGRIAATGPQVALIERKLVGGTCVNSGCTPTKTL